MGQHLVLLSVMPMVSLLGELLVLHSATLMVQPLGMPWGYHLGLRWARL